MKTTGRPSARLGWNSGLVADHFSMAVAVGLYMLVGCGTISKSWNLSESESRTDHFERSRALFAEGNFEGAYKENQTILSQGRGAADVALYNMGVLSVYSSNPSKNYPRALASFRALVKDYPRSLLAEQARAWIQVLETYQKLAEEKYEILEEKQKLLEENRALIREKEALSQERERLKYTVERSRQVDIDIEKRRRQTLPK